MKRCKWVEGQEQIYLDYHDNEWGKPVYDDHMLYEMFLLETFQAGLSWITILKKRDNFKEAFDNYDVYKIAKYNDDKIKELLNNPGIIRNRLKVNAAVNNAKIVIEIIREYGSFSEYLWAFSNHQIITNTTDDFNTTSSLSDKISKDMTKRGMKFVGSVTIYFFLQAVGIINDHETTCFCYKKS